MKITQICSLPDGQRFEICGLEDILRNLKVKNVTSCGTYISGEKKVGLKVFEDKPPEIVWGFIGENYVISNGTSVRPL